MKKNRKAKTGRSVRSAKRVHKLSKSSRKTAVVSKKLKAKPPAKLQRQQKPAPAPVMPGKKAADEVPTLEQVTLTCANCGRPFKVFKLKGLSLEGTICQRCSFGETELPESFGG